MARKKMLSTNDASDKAEGTTTLRHLQLTNNDNWKHRSLGMRCRTCIFFVVKYPEHPVPNDPAAMLGRCRRHAPTLSGWPVVYEIDWCGDHKIDEEKL